MFPIVENGSAAARTHLIIAHGAGAGMTSAFLDAMAEALANRDIHVIRFEFAYMASRRDGGKKRPPPKAEKLIQEYESMVDGVADKLGRPARLFIGGKSLGGRVASLVAEGAYRRGRIAGLVCLGYPFHPPGKPEKLRTAHLETMTCPALIVQGERDPFGNTAEVQGMALSPAIRFAWIGDGDHDLKPRVASGLTHAANLKAAADAVAGFALKRR